MEPKPGWKTTEAWALLFLLGSLTKQAPEINAGLDKLAGSLPDAWSGLVLGLLHLVMPTLMALAVAKYAQLRTELKQNLGDSPSLAAGAASTIDATVPQKVATPSAAADAVNK